MSIAGLWHGASWNFILWGFVHGFLLSIEKIKFFNNIKNYLPKMLKIFLTCFIVFNLWVVFRISDFETLKIFFRNNNFIFHILMFG